jgi:hypothetical protein
MPGGASVASKRPDTPRTQLSPSIFGFIKCICAALPVAFGTEPAGLIRYKAENIGGKRERR